MPCDQQNGLITGYVVRYYATHGGSRDVLQKLIVTTRYYVTCGADRDVQWNKSVMTTGDTIDGLTPNTEYAFQVAAVIVNGTGPFSEPITLGGK